MEVLVKSLTEAINSSQAIKTTEPGTYDGTRDALKIDSWVRSVERYANFYGWNDARTKSYALTLLRGQAEAWYRSLEVAQDEPTNWLDFKRELIAFFRPESSRRMARDRLCSYYQGTMAFIDYINGLTDIVIGIPGMTDDEMTDCFMRGISDRRIRTHIRQVQADILQESIHAAIAFNSAQLEEDRYQPEVYFDRRMGQEGSRLRAMKVEDPMKIDAIEFRRRPNFQRNRNYGVCFYCGQPGHRKARC